MTSKRGKSDFLELVKTSRPRAANSPRVLTQIQQHLQDHCERLLKAAFAASDDAFYELSNRAGSNSEEVHYFESMRQIRLAQESIARTFRQNLAKHFQQILAGAADANSQTSSFSAQTLSIMDGDELEIDLALKNMVTLGRDLYREPLYELNVRFSDLLPNTPVDEAINPMDPQQIARAFIDACAGIAIDIKVRLILFKLFEKHLLKALTPVYAEANDMLVAAGVLPKVSRQLQKSPSAPAPKADQPEPKSRSQNQGSGQAGAQPNLPPFNVSLDALVSLMATARSAIFPPSGNQAPVVNCYIIATTNPGPLLTAPQLTALLTRAQLLADRQLAQSPRNMVPEVVEALLRKGHAEAPRALGETDETIINLVSLFFEQILADDNLPLAVYALICRLQIPILKVALQDPSFFSRPDHPARALINTMTETGIGFDESRPLERDPVYRKTADIVQTLSREPKIDESVFAASLRELKTLIRAEQLKINIVEKRTSQSAVGRSRIRNAKKNAQNLLYSKLHGMPLPLAVREFLTTAWLQVLIITQLKHGHDSNEWFSATDTVMDLIWLCQRHQDLLSLQRREDMQYSLLQRIEAGLEAAIENPEVRSAKTRDLQQALQGISTGSAELCYETLTPEQKAALGQGEEPGLYREEPMPRAYRVNHSYLEKARDLPEGTWIEYTDEHTGIKSRYKLVAKADPEAFVFVNRMGFKTLERSCNQLAHDMQTRRMKPLACTEFFDRMMNKVLSRISDAA